MASTKNKSHPIRIKRSWMMALADRIYNPRTQRFLRLCNGTLQNGPDPKDPARPMHCGLGELYFAMTGHQPQEDRVSEAGVVRKAVELAGFAKAREESINDAIEGIRGLGLNKDLKRTLLGEVKDVRDDRHDDAPFDMGETRFSSILSDIPTNNDDDTGACRVDGEQSWENYRNRARRVATQLRKAAKYIPE